MQLKFVYLDNLGIQKLDPHETLHPVTLVRRGNTNSRQQL